MSQIRQYDILFTSASPIIIELTETLSAGTTTVIFEDNRIHADCSVAVYANAFQVNPESVSTIDGKITVVFPKQKQDVSVKVRFV